MIKLVSVAIPAHVRVDMLLRTLCKVTSCCPAPAEILVHVDGGVTSTMEAVRLAFPQVRLLSSDCLLGPGGARDAMIRSASHEWVATFDDDSYPDHLDYFDRILENIHEKPDAAIFSSGSLPQAERHGPLGEVAVFSGCGCVYNRAWYLKTQGYVPRAVAYNLEEVDLSLQLHALGGRIWHDPRLNVHHDHQVSGPVPSSHVAAVMVNMLLFPLIRYPAPLWPLGLLQALRYVLRATGAEKWKSIQMTVRTAPGDLLRHWHLRRPVSNKAFISWWMLRRRQWKDGRLA